MRLASRPCVFALLLLLAGCSGGGEVWFVHATDPHFFHPKKDAATRLRAEREDQTAFDDMLKTMAAMPGGTRPRFLVITGDFGIDAWSTNPTRRKPAPAEGAPPATETPAPAETPAPTKTPPPAPAWPPKFTPQSDGVWDTVRLLRASPVKDIYFVPGNNDVENESTEEDSLAVTRSFLQAVREGLGDSVKLHDLTSCYFDGKASDDGCIAEIEGTPYRLVGFPSHSFKNSDTDYGTNSDAQARYLAKLGSLVGKASQGGKRALIVTHIPELDDPYSLEEWRQGKLEKKEGSPRPDWALPAAWNVPNPVYGEWKKIVDRDSVAGVLAGHFHDSHRQIYYPPYGWSTAADKRPDPNKVFVAPPLSAKNQEAEPVQARGFALFRVGEDRLERRLYWYDANQRGFQADPGAEPSKPAPGWRARSSGGDLAREALIAVALLLALLLVFALWEIRDGAVKDGDAPAFSNVLKTAGIGLGGLAVAQFLGFTKSPGATALDGRAFYAIWFVVFFLTFLLLYAVVRWSLERKKAPAAGVPRRFGEELLAVLRGRR